MVKILILNLLLAMYGMCDSSIGYQSAVEPVYVETSNKVTFPSLGPK